MTNENDIQIPGGYQMNQTKGSPVGFLISLVVGLVVIGGGLFVFKNIMGERERVDTLAQEAQKLIRADDAAGLLGAVAKYEEIGSDKFKEDYIALGVAETQARLYQAYGLTDSKAKADEAISIVSGRGLEKASRYVAEAYMKIASGNAAGAEDTVKSFLDRGARDPKLLHALSVAQLQQGKVREAQKAAEEGGKLAGSSLRLSIALGNAQLAQGNYPAAARAFNKVLQVNAAHIDARAGLLLTQALNREGSAKLVAKEIGKLKNEIESLGQPLPELSARLTYTDAVLKLSQGDIDGAIAGANAALGESPRLASALMLKGEAFCRKGEIAQAKTAFETALTASPTNLSFAKRAFEAFAIAGRAEDGVPLIASVQKADESNGQAYADLAVAYAYAGDAENAKKTAELAVEKLGNASPQALFAEGRALQAARDYENAQKKYQEAMKLKGGAAPWAEVYYEMGVLKMSDKSFDQAAEAFKVATIQWEKKAASVDKIAHGYEMWAKAMEQVGGKEAKKQVPVLKAKVDELRFGKKEG